MTVYDGIILTFIVIGIIIIIVSFLLGKYEKHLSKQESIKIEQKADRRIDYDEVVQKIIELNEYGEYLKSDLDKRQKELIFMYQMLLDKQKELNIAMQESHKENKTFIPKENKSEPIDQNSKEANTDINSSKRIHSNFNKEIIDLTIEGYTSTEIAKRLNIGRGQVELVQNLYR